ncbi:MAG: hypothetical protein NTY98_09295 [Verrucomicrobia bacterium]|nr:hypothetical protein [Verrucomicrobiota bacterium]
MTRVLIVSVCLSLWLGAGVASAANGLPKQWLDKAAATQWLAAHPGGASFASRNGNIQGGDSDAMVRLTHPDKAELTEFGAAIGEYKGTYEISDAGEITLHLEGQSPKWPVMHLFATAREAWLLRKDRKTGLLGDGDLNFGGTPFWPFKWTGKGR